MNRTSTLSDKDANNKLLKLSYKTLLNSISHRVFIKDKESNYVFCNDSYAKDLGITPEEIVGKSDFDFYPKELAEKYRDDDRVIISENSSKNLEEQYIIDGNDFITHTIKSSIKDEKNNPQGVFGIFWDVTKEINTREKLEKQQGFLEGIFYGVSLPIFVIDVEENGVLRFNRINPANEKISGMSNDWLKGKTTKDLEEFITKEGVEHIEQKYNSCLVTKKPVHYDEMILLDGKETWWNTTLTPLKDKNGVIYRIVGTASSLTKRVELERELKNYQEHLEQLVAERTKDLEATNLKLKKEIETRKKIEQELKFSKITLEQNQKRLNLALEASKVGVWNWDLEKDIFTWDERMREIFGTEVGKLQNYDSFISCLHPDDREKVRNEITNSMENNLDFNQNFKVVWKDGTTKHVTSKGRFFYNYEGKPIQMHGISIDETKRIEKEFLLKDLNQKLNASNKELEQFAYVASHDLQEPLRKIISFLNIIDKRYKNRLDSKGIQFINYTIDAAGRMKMLINELLKFSRIGINGNDFQIVSVNEIIKNVLNTFLVTIKEKKVKIEFPEEMPNIFVDSLQIEMLFQNLIGNAIKFCNQAQPKITIKFSTDTNFITFSITDNGIGIENDYQDKIFEIFQRLHNRQDFPGSGIGLSICKKIVERHGGNIWFKSELGKGTTFYFTTPIRLR